MSLAAGSGVCAPAGADRPVWDTLLEEAIRAASAEPLLRSLLEAAVLRHADLASALASLLAGKLAFDGLPRDALADLSGAALAEGAEVAAEADLLAIRDRDPAAEGMLAAFLGYKGFHALQAHRVAHWLWGLGRRDLARVLHARAAERFGVDIHPAVPVGRGVFIDHGTGVVIGETAVIGDNVSILQEVTLGGTGKDRGDRHPKIRDGVLLAAGAKVLGNIVVGRGAKVGAGSVVLADVPACATVAGIPARIVGWCRDAMPGLAMDQVFPDRHVRDEPRPDRR
jgi:serine O-acetyltransferase